MKRLLLVIVLVQLTFLTVLAQITFTREWVTGKRSVPPTHLILKDSRGQQRLLPGIEYLMKNENLKKLGYGFNDMKRYALPWRISEVNPKSLSGDPLKEEEAVQYDIEIPNQKYKSASI